jgi:hypothetical protein
MQAVYYTRQGPAREVLLGEQPLSAPGAGEVRVRLRSSGVNPSDWKVRRGGFNRPLAGRLILAAPGRRARLAVGRAMEAAVRNGGAIYFDRQPASRSTAAHTDYSAGACLGMPALTGYRSGLRGQCPFVAVAIAAAWDRRVYGTSRTSDSGASDVAKHNYHTLLSMSFRRKIAPKVSQNWVIYSKATA